MRLTIVAPGGREQKFTFADTLEVHTAARRAARQLGHDGPWTLARDGRTLAAVLGLDAAGVVDGERLELRPL